ncbi:acetyl-coenzyme A transporter 1-like [Liolophura sinensis]|uniref:acetyl-coenzyme A transporter 1-like n=1 Tax=Liolophura sinensis TaxID=3198878 RepID=UPI00315882DF
MGKDERDGSSRQRKTTRLVETAEFITDSTFSQITLDAGDSGSWQKKSKSKHTEGIEEKMDLTGDRTSVALLMFLYILQGIPLGLAGSIPMVLQSRRISYKEQALFSFVYWPFSIKLLWAPIVDAVYVERFGRRKSWLVPTQYLIGLFMIVLSGYIPMLLGETDQNAKVDILTLTIVFFMLNFLAATQDIAVDGWALTMLSRRNIGWASTCNTVGQTAGYFLGNVLFLALESADFCNKYLRSVPEKEGLVTLAGFLYFWGVVFFVTTTLVCFLKREKRDPEVDPEAGIVSTYYQLWDVVRLPAVMSYAFIILTAKIGFAAADSLTSLKLIEAGLPKERLALFAVPMVPVQIALPLIISKFTTGPRPMNVWLGAFPVRLFLGLLYLFDVWWTYVVQTAPGEFPWYYYAFVLFSYGLHQVAVYCMFVAQMAFHAKVSDPAIGGTYMTLLNTMANLGGNWPGTLALWMVDGLTTKTCVGGAGDCATSSDVKLCEDAGGKCTITVDGFYIESVICIILGLLWFMWRKRRIQELDSLEEKHWKCAR